ncbi:MAG TPA: long-chain fatty acid--CoA ligase, partial [Candidatus Tectomicrobia bacterium]|nr:long-chain fatty acid--CoA ligase [Candidatus Tectomicrobia bacterium]
ALNYPIAPAWWLLERNLDEHPERVAVRDVDHDTLVERQAVTYAELASRARALAAGLQRLGVGRGARVALCLPNSTALITGFYGIWQAGATVVPINPMARAADLRQQLGDADVSLLIASSDAAAAASAAAGERGIPLVLSGGGGGSTSNGAVPFEELLAEDGRRFKEIPIDPHADVAVILYTGGTTGIPKGAMLTHRNIVANTVQFAEWYAFEPGQETCIGVLPMFHSGGMSGAMNVPLYAGATLLVLSRFRPAAVARAVERYRATRLFGVPTMFIALLNHEASRRADYASLRACRTNAAPLPPSVKAAFDALVGREVLVEGYGLTETSPLTHANPLHKAKPGSIGIPIADTDAKVVDPETGADIPAGRPGELVIRGPQVMKGYWNRPDETATALAGGWFHTGDVARMDADGYFNIVDRQKDLINTAGFKVWPREVEEVIYSHPAVQMVAVIGVEDAYRGEVVKACVVLKDEHRHEVDQAALVSFCQARLMPYKVPRLIEFRDELPVNAAGKMLRRLLRDGAA